MVTAYQILKSYGKSLPKSTTARRKKAERVLSAKMCRCLKKLEPKFGPKAIGICTKSIFGKRGLTRGKFKCKKKQTLKYKQKTKKKYVTNKTK